MVKSGQAWAGLVVTRDATGALAAASVGPAGTLYVNGTSNGAGVTITGSNPYKWAVTLPSLTAGDSVSMYITATVGGIATAAVVAEEIGDTSRVSDVETDTADIQSRLPAALVSGRVDASVGEMATQVITHAAFDDSAITSNVLESATYMSIGSAVRTELATELARIDAATSTRLATAGYTAPLDAAGTRAAVGLSAANLDNQLSALPTATENADELLKRDWSAVTGEAARSVLNALRFLRNKWAIASGTLTVYKEDDATSAWTGTTSSETSSDVVTGVDP